MMMFCLVKFGTERISFLYGTDSSFRYHLENAKKNGITKTEIAEILTHAAFYAGWPKAWAAFRIAKEVWGEKHPEGSEKETWCNRQSAKAKSYHFQSDERTKIVFSGSLSNRYSNRWHGLLHQEWE